MKNQYITMDENLKVGGYAIADGDTTSPVKVLRLGQIFAKVKNCATGYAWEIMANRLKAVEPSKTVLEFEGERIELTPIDL